jgi:Skp family chaperone for outer membrane proteins
MSHPRPLLILVVVMLGLAWGPARMPRAQQLPPAVAAVIDYQRILRDAAAARSIREQIESRRKDYQDEISKQEHRLYEADKAFAKQRSLLTPEAFADKRRAFEEDVSEVQRLVQERRRELDRVAEVALNEVKIALIEIVTGIAEERGFNLVLPSSEVLFFARKIDLTEEVLAKLDAMLPDVTVPEAAPQGSGAGR